MGLPEVASWYQKKIGTYDKQQWEKTIEQRILHGLTHIPMKTTKLKTDFIDVDLVRGSSFPKAKPKHGFATVARLGTLRLMLLPLFSRWWVKQTSPRIFAILLLLYLLQLFTIAVTVCNTSDDSNEHISTSEIFIPVTMMLLLSIIHSQIVSTNPGPDKSFPEQKSRKTRKRRRLRHRLLAATNKTSQDMCLDTNRYQLSSKDGISSGYKKVKICTDENGIITINRLNKYDVPVLSSLHSGESSKDDVKIAQAENELNEDNVEKSCEMIKNNQSMQPPSLLVTDEQQQQQQPEVVQEPLALDDDGFESLNGNVSSENGEEPFLETLQTQNLSDDVFNLPSNSSTPVKIHPSTSKCKKICKTWVDDVCNAQNSDSGLHHRKSATDYVCSSPEHESETDTDTHLTLKNVPITKLRINEPEKCRTTQTLQIPVRSIESSGCDSEEEGDCDNLSSPGTGSFSPLHADATTSATEWMGVTTNSEDCTYSSEYDESDSQSEFNSNNDQSFAWDFDLSPTAILSPSCAPSDRVSCTIWERHDIKKADLSVLDISSTIIEKVEAMPESLDYFYGGVVLSILLSLVPAIFRLGETVSDPHYVSDNQHKLCVSEFFLFQQVPNSVYNLLELCLGSSVWERSVMIIAIVQRCILGVLFFFLLAVAERTFKQRFLYAKLFSHLTSSRRARKSNLPHFRLNKVRNIKTWLSVRSYLKKRGPQRSVDVIVSAAFIITLILLSFISMEFLRDSVSLHSRYNLEAVLWSLAIGIYLLRFMTIGTKINRKYRNLSVLITEQINLYLQIEQKPHKKDELMVANSVLKLAADLLKELESPFKISGLSANPYLYTITKVVILSALSGVLSEMLGFKLKLHKIKIK